MVPPEALSHGPIEHLDEVCKGLEDGLSLEAACGEQVADVRPYYAAIRRESTNDPSTTDDDRMAARRVKQAQSRFERQLMKTLRDPGDATNVVPAAKAMMELLRERVKLKNLKVQYNGRLLLDVCRRHVTDDQFRAILAELCELDPEMATADLDRRVFGESVT